jgi:deoxyribonuclease V
MFEKKTIHSWNLDPRAAQHLQRELRPLLELHWEKDREIKLVGGVDVAYKNEYACAAIAVLSFPGMVLQASFTVQSRAAYPYIPGLLAFREGPLILQAINGINKQPDLLFLDGHGTVHPRGLGLASHIGLLLDLPAIGVAKSKYYRVYSQPGNQRGDWSPIGDECEGGRIIGASLRTGTASKPVYVSPGNHIDLLHAIQFTLDCSKVSRLPEPLRAAHHLANQCIK